MLVTGRNIGNCTIRGNDGAYTPFREADSKNNIAGTLRKAGYTSALFGKWGLGDFSTTGYPTNQSFDRFSGYDSQVACHDWYPAQIFSGESPLDVPDNKEHCRTFSEDLFRNETVAFLEERAKTPEQPFFAWVSYVTPHSGFCEHEQDSHVQPGPYAVPDLEPEYANREWKDAFKGYASAISRQDRDTGIILNSLQRLGLAENTIVFFASDNGPEADPHTFFDSNGEAVAARPGSARGVPPARVDPGRAPPPSADRSWPPSRPTRRRPARVQALTIRGWHPRPAPGPLAGEDPRWLDHRRRGLLLRPPPHPRRLCGAS